MTAEPKEFKGEYRACVRCLKQYKINLPYAECNSPARDLCDDCIISLDPDEFKAYGLKDPDPREEPRGPSPGLDTFM